jgi:hypothetical protein
VDSKILNGEQFDMVAWEAFYDGQLCGSKDVSNVGLQTGLKHGQDKLTACSMG